MGIDFSEDRWQRIRKNAQLWWAGKLGRPLFQITLTGQESDRERPALREKDFVPCYGASASCEQIVDRWDYELSCRRFIGDAFPQVWPNFGAGVAAVFMGAKLEARDETVWFHPDTQSELADVKLRYDHENLWLKMVRDLCQVAGERWQGLVQIGMTDLGGTLDILSTFRPGQQLLLDLYDHPSHVKRLTWQIHELWFRYFEEIDAILRQTNPGYSAWPGFYCRQMHYMLQCDFSYMISAEMFEEFVKPELVASCRRLASPFYHLDGPGALRHLDSLLDIPELKGIQWVPGSGQPDCKHWPEVYRKIRDAGKLIQIWIDEQFTNLDVLAEQLGSADGIVVCGEVPAENQPQLVELLERYGAT